MLCKPFPLCLVVQLLILTWTAQGKNQLPDSVFNETEVQVDTGIYTLYGSLLVPDGKGKMPVVLFIPGSGPTDRDGNNPYGLATNCYRQLAAGLYSKGIASLRFDKRGVGKSKPALENESRLVLGSYVNDAEKWVTFLRKDQRFSKVFILGHSEGALIGTITANFQRADGFISIAGSGFSADTVILNQITRQSPAFADTARNIINHIKKGEPFEVNEYLSPIFRPSVAMYLRSWFQLSPVVELSLLRCPVLIIQGTQDIQVSVEDANRLLEAKPGSKMVIIQNMNHILKTVTGNWEENLASYRNPDLPLSPELIPALSEFILHTGK